MQRSALILAGGKGTRLGEQEKALLTLKDKTFLGKTVDVLRPVVDEVIISIRDQSQQKIFSGFVKDVIFTCDKYQGKGPLAGILEGMRKASGNYIFVVACDMPFLQHDVIDLLFKEAVGHDAAVPIWEDGRKEPLHAVYNREQLISVVERSILMADHRVLATVSQLHDVRYISVEMIRLMDRELMSFININTPLDLEQIIRKGVYQNG